MKRFIGALIFVAAALSAHAQKAYVESFSGPVLLVRANGSSEAVLPVAAVAYGDLAVTGTGGSITLVVPGGFSVSVQERSVLGYFYSGPGTSPEPFFSVIAGACAFARSGNDAPEQAIRAGDATMRAGPEQSLISSGLRFPANPAGASACAPLLSLVSARLDAQYARLSFLESEYENATSRLDSVTEEYRLMIPGANAEALQAFREKELYPAQDERSSIIGEIKYGTAVVGALRRLVLAPLYMEMKSRHPVPDARTEDEQAFFAQYAEIMSRGGDHDLR